MSPTESWMQELERDIAETERNRIIRILLEDCTCQYDRGELVEVCTIHNIVEMIREHSE